MRPMRRSEPKPFLVCFTRPGRMPSQVWTSTRDAAVTRAKREIGDGCFNVTVFEQRDRDRVRIWPDG